MLRMFGIGESKSIVGESESTINIDITLQVTIIKSHRDTMLGILFKEKSECT